MRDAADVLRKPKTEVVPEANADYADPAGRLTESERRRLLDAFDELVPAIPARPEQDVVEELTELRRARRGRGGRMTAVDSRGLTTTG